MMPSIPQVDIMIVIFSDPLFHFCKTQFSILNANIRGMVTNLDNFKFFLDDLNNNFPIIGVTENWLKPHNVDSYFIEGYTHEYDLRPKRPGRWCIIIYC